MSDTAARVITIIGLVICGIGVFYLGYYVFISIYIIAVLSWIPFSTLVLMGVLIFSLVFFVIGLITGLILPGVAYGRINENSKTSAAVILIICGIIDILIVSWLGGILLLVGGIVAAVWKPYEHEVYQPYTATPPVQYPPSTTPVSKPVFEASEAKAPQEKAFCMHCGSKLVGGEKFCPTCGASLE
ncbi:MAG: zinc ribbon domain-containing protein [Promethearchaeota archaeon]